jgi:hypothetical protein
MNRDIIRKIQENLDFKENKIGSLERFVEFYIPITIQSQLSETLSVILSRQNLNKLEAFEQEKFKQLNENVLNAHY